jgi:hypothetical protein
MTEWYTSGDLLVSDESRFAAVWGFPLTRNQKREQAGQNGVQGASED